ncbi:MAG TPA: MFS transporter [Steroidobacteraceae bacterium]|nr:MFS transporter [Steroidobacteraceae bacterium]
MNPTIDTGGNAGGTVGRVGNYRWVICALLFIATTTNYIDRNALGVLKPFLQDHLGWDEVDYGWIVFAFVGAYAAFPSIVGIFIDKVGVKRSLATALIVWSIAAAAHGLVATVIGFVIVRFFLGVAEAANFPASIKAVAMWFPQKERALATGIFNAGTSVGVIAAPVTVLLAQTLGWQWSFVLMGLIGFIWLYFWQRSFHPPETHPHVGAAELEYIRSGRPAAEQNIKLSWSAMVRYRQIWPFLIGKFLTDPVWWFFLFWLPTYLSNERGQDLLKSAGLMAIIYTGSSVGSVFGGWLSGFFIRRGWHVGKARMTTMLLAAIFMPGSILAYFTDNFAVCVGFITLATACHQWWSANIFTSATDLFPQKVSGSVVGLGATAGGIGGMFIALLAALAIQWTGKQELVFIWAGFMHLLSLAIYWFWFKGRFDPVDVDAGIDLHSRHTPLLASGSVIAILGFALMLLIGLNWDVCVQATNLSGAAQALTAALGVFVIGGGLAYAGMAKKQR